MPPPQRLRQKKQQACPRHTKVAWEGKKPSGQKKARIGVFTCLKKKLKVSGSWKVPCLAKKSEAISPPAAAKNAAREKKEGRPSHKERPPSAS